jgi:hypothetical protein
LYFDEQGAQSFDGGGDGDAAEVFFFLGDEDLAGVGDGAHALIAHFIDAEFGGTAKTIFEGT